MMKSDSCREHVCAGSSLSYCNQLSVWYACYLLTSIPIPICHYREVCNARSFTGGRTGICGSLIQTCVRGASSFRQLLYKKQQKEVSDISIPIYFLKNAELLPV